MCITLKWVGPYSFGHFSELRGYPYASEPHVYVRVHGIGGAGAAGTAAVVGPAGVTGGAGASGGAGGNAEGGALYASASRDDP